MLPMTSSSSVQEAVLTAQHACRDGGVILLAREKSGENKVVNCHVCQKALQKETHINVYHDHDVR